MCKESEMYKMKHEELGCKIYTIVNLTKKLKIRIEKHIGKKKQNHCTCDR